MRDYYTYQWTNDQIYTIQETLDSRSNNLTSTLNPRIKTSKKNVYQREVTTKT